MDNPNSTTTLKTCSKCGRVLPATTEYFYVSSNKKGLSTPCKKCRLAWQSEYQSDPEVKQRTAARNQIPENKERIRASNRKYSRRPEVRQRRLDRYASDEYKEYSRTRKSSPEYKDQQRKYRARPDVRQRRDEYTEVFYRSDRFREYNRLKRHDRRARESELPSTFTAADWKSALEYFGGCCAVCGRPPGLWHTLAADHWIPINSRDCPGNVPWNIVPLCHDKRDGSGGCNNLKRDRPADEWLVGKFGKRKGAAILRRIEAYLESRK
jgi:hypothetical protein